MLPIAKELQSIFIFGTLILIGVQFIIGSFAAFIWLPWLIFAFLIRDFHRDIPPIPLATISPVDGMVQDIREITNPYLDRPCCCYTILQLTLGEFNLHSPVEGKVEQLWVRYPNSDKKALSYWIKTDENDDLVVHVELDGNWQHGSAALHPGERVGQGRRCGFVAMRCKVHIYLPERVQRVAQIGDKVIAGKNILAQFLH